MRSPRLVRSPPGSLGAQHCKLTLDCCDCCRHPALQIPGLNAPGLVKAKPVKNADAHGFSGGSFDTIRDAGSNHFWSNKGIMNSVPKMKGIITPKSAINGGL